jgi:uncharacterized membrane protein YbhN (UPF0104 family)
MVSDASSQMPLQKPTGRPGGAWKIARRILPWFVAGGLLTWVFWGVPLQDFVDALGRGQFTWYLPAMLCCMVGIFLADTLAISKTFTWFTTDIPFRTVLQIRGASYLMSVINYNLGQGAIVIFANRAKSVSYGRATGTVLLLMGISLVVLILLSAIGLFVTDAPKAMVFRPYVIVLLSAFGVYLAVVAIKPRFLSRWSVAQPMLDAGFRGHLAAIAVRAPHMTLVFIAHYITMVAFGIDIPLLVFLSTMPFVSLMSAIPISPQGLGTTQYAAVYFFAAFAPGTVAQQKATVLAYSLTTSVLAIFFMLATGFFFFRSGMRLLRLDEQKKGADSDEDVENSDVKDGDVKG